MNAISKRLLSFVIVLAMVLSMSPVITLPVAAATDPMTEAAQKIADVKAWEAAYGSLFKTETALASGATVSAPCPFCSPNADVTWTGTTYFSATSATSAAASLVKGAHKYMTANRTSTSANFLSTKDDCSDYTTADAARCVYLNGFNLDSPKQRLWVGRGLNIIAYGSTFTQTDSDDDSYYLIQMNEGPVSIYGGTFIGQDTGKPLISANSSSGILNLYDGTYTSTAGLGVIAANKADGSEINIYGSKLTGGVGGTIVMTKDDTINVYGNETYPATITAPAENDALTISDGAFDLLGGTVSGGKVTVTGGSVKVSGGTLNLPSGSAFTGVTLEVAGGIVNMYDGATISGGTGYVNKTVELPVETTAETTAETTSETTSETTAETVTYKATSGGNVYMSGGTFNMHGGEIYGGTVTGVKNTAGTSYGGRGGNVYIGTNSTFNMLGGKIYDGKIEVVNGGNSYGGNVILYHSAARLNMSGDAEIYGGEAENGGNVQLRSSNEMTMSGNAKVYNGKAITGPNIYLMNGTNPKLTMSDNAKVYGGTNVSEDPNEPNKPGNIRMYGGTLIMEDNATVLGGDGDGSAISVYFGQNPLIVLKDNATVKSETDNIKNQINGGRILITEGWAGEAYASLNATYGEQVDTAYAVRGSYDAETATVTAADVAFTGKLYVSYNKIEALADSKVTGGIVLAEEPAANEPVFGTFDPEGYEGMAYCEACYEKAKVDNPDGTEDQWKAAALKEWTAYDLHYDGAATDATTQKTSDTHEHFYLAESVENYDANCFMSIAAGTVCFHLNGKSVTKDLTETKKIDSLFYTAGTLNIMGTGTVTGEYTAAIAEGCALTVASGGICNLYGGTYQDAPRIESENNVNRVIVVSDGGTLNMYEGVKVDGQYKPSSRSAVYVAGTFNMHGGEIIGRNGLDTAGGAAVHVAGAFTMNDGEIHGGYAPVNSKNTALNGGNIRVDKGTFTMNGGKIYDGEAAGGGGNVYVDATDATFIMNGGKIYDGVADAEAGNIYIGGGTFVMAGGEISGGVSNNESKESVFVDEASTMIMSGEAKIYGGTETYSALFINGTGDNASKLVLRDKASILDKDGNSTVGVIGLGHARTIDTSKIVVEPSWTGEACVYMWHYYLNGYKDDGVTENWSSTSYVYGDVLDRGQVVFGTYDAETGEITSSNQVNGVLYANSSKRVVGINANNEACIAAYTVETKDDRAWYGNMAAALANYDVSDKAYIGVWTNEEVTLTEDAYIANMDGAVPAKISGAFKLYAMDITQDDYKGTAKTWVVADEVEVIHDFKNPVTGNRYLCVTTAFDEEAATESFYSTRLNMYLSHVSLRAGKTSEGMGLYYKATISMSAALAGKVDTHGVVLSLNDMPGANFVEEGNENGFTEITDTLDVNADNGYTVTLNSGSVFGIMLTEYETLPDGYTKETLNAEYGKMPIYANAYLLIDLDGDAEEDVVMADNDTDTTNDVAWSLYSVLDTIDDRWTTYGTDVQEKITDFYGFWYEHGMNQWSFDNIKKLETV